MKRILLVALLIGIILVSVGLVKTDSPINDKMLDPEQTTIEWTAYKTTDKIAVKGVFDKVNFKNSTPGHDLRSALENTIFEIPVKSIFSNDLSRDAQLRRSFFKKMIDTEFIKGSINLKSENNGVVQLTMNGLTHGLPFTYTIEDEVVHIECAMDLNNWKAQAAIEALNKACKDLHTGPDGVTMTWSEVAISVKTQLK